ncbi:MAG: DUF4388 domain-containing protein [Deltaproteobacteria bacterium]|nr:MAG: DUF4388 domain-containing protein [Deltaproteobacteria bacterium]
MPPNLSMEPVAFGPYVLTEHLGRGGMAEVLRARSFGAAGFSRDVAIKRILPVFAEDEEFTAMFVDEARTMVSLNHPNVVQVYDLGELDGYYYMAMEYVFGKDLLDLLAASSRARQRLPREIVLHVISETLRGLSFVHGACDMYGQPLQIIHRDVSPSNVMLSYSGHVKLGDFGIAKSRLQTRLTAVGTQKGKFGYMSPEQALGEPLDARSDLFAVGVLLFECLTMSRLFKADDELDAMRILQDANVEPAFERRAAFLDDATLHLLRRSLARDPADRYPNALAFIQDIDTLRVREGLKMTNERLGSFLQQVFAEDREVELQRRRDEEERVRAFLRREESSADFEVQAADGSTDGPFTQETLEAYLANQDHHEGLRIRQGIGPFRPVEEFRELLPVLRRLRHQASGNHEAVKPLSPSRTHHRAGPAPSGNTDPIAAPAADRPPLAPAARPIGPDDPGGTFLPPASSGPWAASAIPRCIGSLADHGVGMLLAHIAERRGTGTLILESGDSARRIFFRDGQVVQASTEGPEERLGAVAVARGILNPKQLQEALDRAREEGRRLGDTLLRHFGLSPHSLFELCVAQLEHKLWPSFAWTSGEWAWLDGDDDWPNDIEVPLPALRIALDGLRRMQPDTVRRLIDGWADSPVGRRSSTESPSGVPLTGHELRLLKRLGEAVGQGSTLAHLAARALAEDESIGLRVLWTSCALGFLTLDKQPPLPEALASEADDDD